MHDSTPFRGRSPANLDKLDDARRLAEQLQSEALRVGWYGKLTLTLSIADGVIQHVEGEAQMKVRRC